MSGPFGSNQFFGVAADSTYAPKGAIWLNGTDEYLTDTPPSPSSQRIGSLSFWVKRSRLGAYQTILQQDWTGSGNEAILCRFNNDDTFLFRMEDNSGSYLIDRSTTALYRDPIAWYHFHITWDTNQASSMACSITVNGKVVTAFNSPSNPSSAADTGFPNTGKVLAIGRHQAGTNYYYDGYFSEFIFLDNVATTASSFGEENSDGVWIPKNTSTGLTYNNAGFRLDFADSSDLGKDVSGNGLDFAANNMAAANSTNDRPADSDSVGNYCTMNPLSTASQLLPLQEGNLVIPATGDGSTRCSFSTMSFPKTGTWGVKMTDINGSIATGHTTGITSSKATTGTSLYNSAGYNMVTYNDGTVMVNGSSAATGKASNTGSGDTTEFIVDMDAGEVEIFVNGSSQGTYTIPSGYEDEEMVVGFNSGSNTENVRWDFGQNGYDPDSTVSGAKTLSTVNFPAPTVTKPSDNFLPILFEGNGTGQRVGNFIPFTDSQTVNYSARCDKAGPDYLTKTYGAGPDVRKMTFSFWLKPGDLSSTGSLAVISGGTTSTSYRGYIGFSSYKFVVQFYNGSAWFTTDTVRLFKGVDSWTHFVVAIDTEQSTTADRVNIYINGVQETNLTLSGNGGYSGLNEDLTFFNANQMAIGSYNANLATADSYDGYISEFYGINNQQLTPSSFGETDTSTNRWIPKTFSGSYGSYDFYLNFADKNDLGDDESGQGNDWAESGFDTTNGSNQMYDTPTRNTAVWNIGSAGSALSFSTGNLNYLGGSSNGSALATMGISSGKFYWEWNWVSTGTAGNRYIGIAALDTNRSEWVGKTTEEFALYGADGSIYTNNAQVSYDSAYAAGDRINIALDMDAGYLWFGKNGTWLQSGNPSTGANPSVTGLGGTYYPAEGSGDATVTQINFGQWIYFDGASTTLSASAGGYFIDTVPTGFKALNQDNISENTAGITGFAWIKNREDATNHLLWDRVNGIYKYVISNTNDVQGTDTNGLQRFLQQGAQVGNMSSINDDNKDRALWQWLAGGTSTPSVNTDAGFSIAKYTGNGSAGNTVTHSLGVAPEFICVKKLAAGDDATSRHWAVYHVSEGNTKYGLLSDSNAFATSSGYWNDTTPGTSTFTVGTDDSVNGNNAPYVAYCWAGVEGYSKFGSWTGNGDADGPFIHCGFKPEFVIHKRSVGSIGNWIMQDAQRNPYNPVGIRLNADNDYSEATVGVQYIDFVANGIKIRNASGGSNTSAHTYIYMAWAQNPFGGSGVAQAKAR